MSHEHNLPSSFCNCTFETICSVRLTRIYLFRTEHALIIASFRHDNAPDSVRSQRGPASMAIKFHIQVHKQSSSSAENYEITRFGRSAQIRGPSIKVKLGDPRNWVSCPIFVSGLTNEFHVLLGTGATDTLIDGINYCRHLFMISLGEYSDKRTVAMVADGTTK